MSAIFKHGSCLPAAHTRQSLSTRPQAPLLPLWSYDVDLNGIRHSGVQRGLFASDVAAVIVRQVAALEMDSADMTQSLVITVQRSKAR